MTVSQAARKTASGVLATVYAIDCDAAGSTLLAWTDRMSRITGAGRLIPNGLVFGRSCLATWGNLVAKVVFGGQQAACDGLAAPLPPSTRCPS